MDHADRLPEYSIPYYKIIRPMTTRIFDTLLQDYPSYDYQISANNSRIGAIQIHDKA